MKFIRMIKAHWNCLKYIFKHRWFVMLECWKRGLYIRGLTHDLSKFLPSEWFAYVNMFYGDYGYKFNGGYAWEHAKHARVREAFDRAWLIHQNRNRHHWQWWILVNDDEGTYPLPMDKKDWIEMICDWTGAGRAIAGRKDPLPWYLEHQDTIILHEETRKAVEEAMGYYAEEGQQNV